MPWEGVKFDAQGQNILTRGIFIQTQNGAPATVWPFDFATSKLVWPRPAWK
jgi:branched-chain amino acid transport system substrate-binding protein